MSVDSAADIGTHTQRFLTGHPSPLWDPLLLAPEQADCEQLEPAPPDADRPEAVPAGDQLAGDQPAGDGPARSGPAGDGQTDRGQTDGGQTDGGPAGGPNARAEFQDFFENHHRELSRFAYLLTGDRDAADDLTADALTAAWTRWDRVSAADSPLAYVRRILANLATSRLRRVIRERRGMTMLGMLAEHSRPAADSADLPAAVDLRAALMSLPVRKRACVVLRYAFDLSEAETARVLGVSIGTVKSQTSKAVAELERLLGTRPDLRQPAAPGEPPRRREQLTTLPQMPLRGNTARSRRRSGGVGDPAAPSAGENARPPTPIPRIMGMP